MKNLKRIYKITVTKEGNSEVYYEPSRLPEWVREELAKTGWAIREQHVTAEVEIRRLDPEAWERESARNFSGGSGRSSSIAAACTLAQGLAQERVKKCAPLAKDKGVCWTEFFRGRKPAVLLKDRVNGTALRGGA